MKRSLLRSMLPILLVVLFCGAAAAGSELGRAVPDDVFLYIHGKHNPERDFLKPKYDAIKQAFRDSGVIEEAINLLLGQFEGEEKDKAGQVIHKIQGLIYGVQWSHLIEHESVYTQKMEVPSPPHLFISRMDKEKIPPVMEGIRKIMEEIKLLNEAILIKDEEFMGARVTSLSCCGIPQALNMATIDDTLWLSSSTGFLKTALRRYKENKVEGSILANPLLVKSQKKLHAWEDEIVFFNFKNMMEGYKGLMGFVSVAAAKDPEAAAKIMLISDIIDQFGVYQCLTSITYMDKNKSYEETLLLYNEEDKEKTLHQIFFRPGTVKDYQKFVPANATGFKASPGISLAELYGFIRQYVTEKVPNGAEIVAKVAAQEEAIGIKIEEDILSWMDGSYISISIPALNPSPFGGGDAVFLMGVSDREKGSATIEKLTGMLMGLLAGSENGPKLEITPLAQFEKYQLRSISLATIPFIQPVYGFVDNHFLLATSPGAVESIMAVKDGKAKNIKDNEKLKQCGKLPSSGISSVSFKDKENSAAEMASILAGLSFAGAFIPAENKETAIVKSVLTLLAKLAPVVQKYDFTLAEMSYCSMLPDGQLSRKVTVYKTE